MRPACLIPWRSFYLHSNGKYFPCCVYRKEIGEQKSLTVEKVWQGEEMKELRQQLLKGENPPACVSCWSREEKKILSRRMIYDNVWDPPEHFGLAPSLDEILHYDVTFGNLCNLACLFCGPDKSSRWENLTKDLPLDDTFDLHRRDLKTVSSIDADLVIADVLALQNLEELEIKGGEPFIHPAHLKLLHALVETGRAEKLTLSYSTNLTVLPEKLIETWKRFKRVDISISIDGTEEIQKYIRGKKASLEKVVLPNYRRLKTLPNVSFSTHTTICAYNFFNLEALFERLEQEGLSKNTLGLVSVPTYLAPFVLPKEDVGEYIQHMKASRFEKIRDFFQSLELKDFGSDAEELRKFRRFTEVMEGRQSARLSEPQL